jgi:ribosome-binding factor A
VADTARAQKIADRIKTLTAANLDAIVKDPDLGFVTVTDVRVTGDLQHASLFYTVFGDAQQRATTAHLLEVNKGRLRSFVGKQLGIRLTPSLEFIADAIPETAAHLEDLLKEARERDAQVAAAAARAVPAGDPDPYKKDRDDDEPAAPVEPAQPVAARSVQQGQQVQQAQQVQQLEEAEEPGGHGR